MIKDGTPSSEYVNIANSHENKIAEKEFFGVRCEAPLNLTINKKNNKSWLKLSDGPIEV